ncbi:AI-2E family transporter [Actibacterium ureilyticum]|uniref:AI-2E family transporter n=1 Tax=Actibacterium ureilyticum TaxID=1590614 RepID=UPI0015955E84|nr:AI-2E family transporter [Actibacterium ureilyticum]
MQHIPTLSRISLILLAVIAVLTALDAVENIAAPAALALVVGFVLSPLSDFWERRNFPPVIGALLGLALALALLAMLVLVMQPFVLELVDQAPRIMSDMKDTVDTVRGLVQGIEDVTKDVEQAVTPPAEAVPGAPPPADPVDLPSVTDAIVAAPAVLSQILIFGGVLFFFLLTRREIYDWVARCFQAVERREGTVACLRRAERLVSRYFVTITIINACLGLATAIYLQALGLPGAVLWGLVAFLINFVLYLGPAVFAVALLVAGLVQFDNGYALLPALGFIAMNGLEGQFITPALVGRNMQLNPLLVFLSLVFGIWLWGAIGGIVAIPLLIWMLVLTDGLLGIPVTEPIKRDTAA